MQPSEYIELLKTNRSGKVEGLCGRIIRGKTPQCFARLSDDPNRKVVMLTDSEGLQSLLGKKYRPEFGRIPYSVIEQMAGYKFKDADDPKDPRFMSHENFNKRQSKGLAAVRALLYHTLHLRELFRGDGFTYDEHGNRGVREYLLPNVEVSSIDGVIVHDLTVACP